MGTSPAGTRKSHFRTSGSLRNRSLSKGYQKSDFGVANGDQSNQDNQMAFSYSRLLKESNNFQRNYITQFSTSNRMSHRNKYCCFLVYLYSIPSTVKEEQQRRNTGRRFVSNSSVSLGRRTSQQPATPCRRGRGAASS